MASTHPSPPLSSPLLRLLPHHARPAASACLRAGGLDEANVIRARDQLNGILRSYVAPLDSEVEAAAAADWLAAMRSKAMACKPFFELSLREWAAADAPAHATKPSLLFLASMDPAAAAAAAAGSAVGAEGTAAAAEAAAVTAHLRSQPVRAMVMPVGGTMLWHSTLDVAVEVLVGGSLTRTLMPGETMPFLMHTVGMGRYEWRCVLPSSAAVDAAAAAAAAVDAAAAAAQTITCRAEVRVAPCDHVTQYGTFSDDSDEAATADLSSPRPQGHSSACVLADVVEGAGDGVEEAASEEASEEETGAVAVPAEEGVAIASTDPSFFSHVQHFPLDNFLAALAHVYGGRRANVSQETYLGF